MAKTAMLLDYQWCTGCHSCEVACQMDHGYSAEHSGIEVSEVGPWKLPDGSWQYDNVVHLTALCDLCGERRAKGKLAACAQHCQANCLTVGPVEELAEKAAASSKSLLIVP